MNKKYLSAFINCIIYFGFPLIISVVMNYGIKDVMNIHIASDEFGYWTAAANIVKYDWSQCASINEYYSFGYGIILAPLLLLKNPNLTYKIALYLNIFFVILSYFEMIRIVRNLFKITRIKCSLISLSVNLYAGLIFYTKLTLVECLLWFCFCTSILLMQEYLLQGKKRYLVATSLVNIYMLWTHMRTIGIIAALLLSFIVYCIFFRKNLKNFIWIIIIFCLGIFFLFVFKNNLKTSQYSASILSGNELISQFPKLKMLISVEGIKKFLLNIIGRIWYLGISTFLLFYFGCLSCIKKCLRTLRERDKFVFIYLYIFLSLIFAIVISAIFMLEIQGGRRDTLFYGRYSEYIIAPILAFGMIEILENKDLLKKVLIIVAIQLMSAIIVHKTIIAYKMTSCLDLSIPGFYYWIKREEFSNESYFSASLLVILIAIISIFLFSVPQKKICKIAVWLMFCFLSVATGYKAYEISDTHDHDEDYYEVYLNIKDNLKGNSNSLLYCYDEADMEDRYLFMGVDRLQFLLKDKVINYRNLKMGNLPNGATIITRPNSNINEYLKEVCSIILENKEFDVYEYK